MKKKILVSGPALSRSGYGEQTRFALRSLRQYEDFFDIYLINLPWGQTGWLPVQNEERNWIDSLIMRTVTAQQNKDNQYDMSLQITIPNEWQKLAPVNIGYTAGIETTKISSEWVEKSSMMDRIIVVSNHAKYGFDNTSYEAVNNTTGEIIRDFKTTTPITVVNYAHRHFEPENIDLKLDYDFNFLTIAQKSPRKNLSNTVRWFVDEFRNDEVGLIIKSNIKSNSTVDRHFSENDLKGLLGDYKDRKCKVYLLHGDMTDEEMTSLYQHKKVKGLINIAHGEGFGLPMFEASYNELPVVAPSWGGQTDFLYAPVKDKKKNKSKMKPHFATVDYALQQVQPEAVWDKVLIAESMWCFAHQGNYKAQLRDVYKNYGYYKSMAKKLKKHILKTFTEEKQYKLFAEAAYGSSLEKISIDQLPKVSIITSVYDGDSYIRPFLEDITRQTIFDRCELILVNANSPGKEEDVIREYMKKHSNIIYKKLEKDPGIYGTWNEALKHVTGEYVTNANLDDRKALNSLEKHAMTLMTSPDVGLVYADSLVTDTPNETFENNSANGNRYNFEQFSKEAMLRGNQAHNNPMWRKELHERYGVFEEKYKSAGDWEFFLRCAFDNVKFQKLNDVLGLYYFNPKGVSTDPENFKWKQKEEREIFLKYQSIMNQSVIL
tara:strand:+ start:1115 stop:3094 length:1980 start_codon:yes stop_codon:yes gene_type:complete